MSYLSQKWQYLEKYVVILHSQGIPISAASKWDCHCLIRTILNLASDVAITWGKRDRNIWQGYQGKKKQAVLNAIHVGKRLPLPGELVVELLYQILI